MIYPSDLELRLGFDQIRSRLSAACIGELGRAQLTGMKFQTNRLLIEKELLVVREALHLKSIGDDIPLRSYSDLHQELDLLNTEGSHLDSHVMSQLADALQLAEDVNSFLRKHADEHPNLSSLAMVDRFAAKIISGIRAKVDEDGRVRDQASVDLSRIRKRFRDEEGKVRRIAEQIMRRVLDEGWSPAGSNPTIREGRLVIPVAAEHKRRIKGYIVDHSSTGQTVYLEPAEVLEANNDLRDLLLEERKECIRILIELTAFLHDHRDEISRSLGFLGRMDFIRAKTILSQELKSGLPAIKDRPALDWRNARHPLLYQSFRGRRPLVPLTMQLTDKDRFLLVSGPNAGGKSVCLKTTGLIQYMFQCGLLVPVDEDSTMGIFERIFLDIGDQQSIESDLSTYSSHLRNMAHFISNCNDRSLILMDELGSGTDPNFGGGIAQAVLEQLLTKGAWGIATTHYYNLKVFAGNFRGVRNASMQFDSQKLQPLYKLEIGSPGSSFAMEIARNTGLSTETMEAARRIIGRELLGLETLMKQIAEDKHRLEGKDKEISGLQKQLESSIHNYESLASKLESQKKDILNRAKAEASTLLQQTNREIEKTIRHIRENKAEKGETRRARQGLRQMKEKVKLSPDAQPESPVSLLAGDKVRIRGGEVTGTLVSLRSKTAIVQFGDLRSTVSVENLVRSDGVEFKQARSQGATSSMRKEMFSPLLDIRGMRAEEALPLLTRFLDDALLYDQSQLQVLHGKGTGALRKVVRDLLKKTKTVSDFEDGHADRGGDGITVVNMR